MADQSPPPQYPIFQGKSLEVLPQAAGVDDALVVLPPVGRSEEDVVLDGAALQPRHVRHQDHSTLVHLEGSSDPKGEMGNK